MFLIRSEVPGDALLIEPLLDRCFGPDRRQKVSYRYREGVPPLAELAFVAEDEAKRLVGAVRYWPIRLDTAPALLLGPLAIDPDRQRRGIGRALVFHSLEQAAAAGHRVVFLVGDPAYYARFGFAVAPRAIVMPDEAPTRLNYRVIDPAFHLPRKGTLRRCAAPGVLQPEVPAHRAAAEQRKPIATATAIH